MAQGPSKLHSANAEPVLRTVEPICKELEIETANEMEFWL